VTVDFSAPVDGAGWLEALLDEAPEQVIEQHRARLAALYPDRQTAIDKDARITLRLKSLLDQRRQRVTELAALNDVANQLETAHERDSVLQEIVDHARRLLGVDLAYLGLVRSGRFVIEVASGAFTPQLLGLSIDLTVGVGGAVVAKRAPIWTADYQSEGSFEHEGIADAAASAEGIRGLLGVPLSTKGSVTGALFAAKRQERAFSDDEVALLTSLAAHASVAIQNADVLEGYKRTVAELNEANRELEGRRAELERALQWDRMLSTAVLGGGGISAILKQIRGWTGREITFVAPGESLAPDLVSLSEEEQGRLLARAENADEVVVVTVGTQYIALRRVASDQRLQGFLVCVSSTLPNRDEMLLLDRAAPNVGLSLIAERSAAEATRLARDYFLVDILTRSPVSDQRILDPQLRMAGLDPSGRYYVAVAQAYPSADSNSSGIHGGWLPPSAQVVEHRGRYVAVVPADEEDSSRPPLDGMRRNRSLTAAVAGPVSLVGLAEAYKEAVQTIRALLALGREGDVVTAKQLGIYGVLLTHTGRKELEAILQQQLGALIREARRGSPLLETLRAFLDANMRPSAASAALGIHVNTLYQRLESITKILGADWRSPSRSLDLQLLLRLHHAKEQLDR
jgi:hypothetical protein